MSVQRTRLLLRGAALVLLLSSAVLIVWAFQSPPGRDDQASERFGARRTVPPRADLVRSPPLSDLAQVWRTELRRPLYDPPPEAPAAKLKNNNDSPRKNRRRKSLSNGGGLQLVGTMLEDGRSLAVFTDASGRIDLKGVGEMLELLPGARVDRIELTQVTLSEQGRPTVLRLPETKVP